MREEAADRQKTEWQHRQQRLVAPQGCSEWAEASERKDGGEGGEGAAMWGAMWVESKKKVGSDCRARDWREVESAQSMRRQGRGCAYVTGCSGWASVTWTITFSLPPFSLALLFQLTASRSSGAPSFTLSRSVTLCLPAWLIFSLSSELAPGYARGLAGSRQELCTPLDWDVNCVICY